MKFASPLSLLALVGSSYAYELAATSEKIDQPDQCKFFSPLPTLSLHFPLLLGANVCRGCQVVALPSTLALDYTPPLNSSQVKMAPYPPIVVQVHAQNINLVVCCTLLFFASPRSLLDGTNGTQRSLLDGTSGTVFRFSPSTLTNPPPPIPPQALPSWCPPAPPLREPGR